MYDNASIKISPCIREDIRLCEILNYIDSFYNIFLEYITKKIECCTQELSKEQIKEIKNDIIEELKESYSDYKKILQSKNVESIADEILNKYKIPASLVFIRFFIPSLKDQRFCVRLSSFDYFYKIIWKIMIEQYFISLTEKKPFIVSMRLKKKTYLDFYPELDKEKRFRTFKRDMNILMECNGIKNVNVVTQGDFAYIKVGC